MKSDDMDDYFKDALRRAVNKSFRCGTGLSNRLNLGIKNYHDGKSLGEGVSADEVEMIINNDWSETARVCYPDGTEEPVFTPRAEIIGHSDEVHLLDKDDIIGFIPKQ